MFYALKSETQFPKGFFPDIIYACKSSQVQLTDRSPISITIPDELDFGFKDFYYADGVVPLFSEYITDKIKSLKDIDNVFFKEVNIYCCGEYERFFIVIPSRIRCLDLDSAVLEYVNGTYRIKKYAVSEDAVGRFVMFKIYGVDDDHIYVSEKLKKILAGCGLICENI